MGTEAFWIPAALAAAGTGVDMYNTKRTTDRRDDIALAGLKKQGVHQRNADARITQELDAMEASSPEDERKASLDQYLTQLRSARATAQGPQGGPGGGRFKEDSRTAKAGIDNFGQRVAGTVSRIGAAGKQRQGERVSAGRMAADVGGIGRNASGDAAVNRMKIDSVQLDPWLQGLGAVLKAAGMAYGVSGMGGAAGANATAGSAGGLGAGGGSAIPQTIQQRLAGSARVVV
jgi:hypothetical protein